MLSDCQYLHLSVLKALSLLRKGAASFKPRTCWLHPLMSVISLQQQREPSDPQDSSLCGDIVTPLPQSSHWPPFSQWGLKKSRAAWSSLSHPRNECAQSLSGALQSHPLCGRPHTWSAGRSWQSERASASPGFSSLPPQVSNPPSDAGGSGSTLFSAPSQFSQSQLSSRCCQRAASTCQNWRQRGRQPHQGRQASTNLPHIGGVVVEGRHCRLGGGSECGEYSSSRRQHRRWRQGVWRWKAATRQWLLPCLLPYPWNVLTKSGYITIRVFVE